MNEHAPRTDGHMRVEIGIDGKPYEVWDPRAAAAAPAAAPAPVASAMPGNAGAPDALRPAVDEGWQPAPVYQRGSAEAAVLAAPRRTTEFNHYATYSLGLGIFSLFLAAVLGVTGAGGIGVLASLALAAGGAYYGMRAHSAGLRGFCTNGRLGLVGLIISAIAALVGLVVFLRPLVMIATM